ncbi:WD40 repeat [Streptomyces sp. 2224.1]|uniref:WD40 domain-containing protein n=1 Tax=Streptomyces sp. 2224.1 TaxID=1881020 RepID=UPI00089D3025|nr:TIR domain-containing protein [Streptomyces sp. 2224.1]SED53036.1 WD40 repeat [Streptomyces sp. 2224.1]
MVARQEFGEPETRPETGPLDFFISYSPADERWASWIAWTLEEAGYRTVVQAWDFVPGTNFVDFMDRGVSESAAVIAVLSSNYERSRYGRMEWQAALRADPDAPERRLLTVRVEDIPVEGLLATITYVDLVGVTDTAAAREMLLTRVGQALDGRARPTSRPGYPGGPATGPATPAGIPRPQSGDGRPLGRPGWAGRRRPAVPPQYPQEPGAQHAREAVTVLHLAGPAFGRGQDPAELQAAIWGDLVELTDAGAPAPDLLVVTGDLTASGSPRETDQALSFLTGLRSLLGLEPHRLAVVPGGQDVSQAACRAYFHTCEADEMQPRPPYWPKWRHYARLFHELYQGLDVVFDSDQPWSLFPVPELRTVIAGLNSSMAYSHRPDDQYGWLGPEQAAWFAQALRPYEQEGWLRLGALRHPVTEAAGRPGSAHGPGPLRDSADLARLTAPRLHLLLHGPTGDRRSASAAPPATPPLALTTGELPVYGALAPARHQLLRITRDGLTRWRERPDAEPEHFAVGWRRAQRVFGPPRPQPGAEGGTPGDGTPETAGPAVPEHEPGLEARTLDDPLDELVARVAEVCRTRHDGAQLRRIAGRPPQLLVTWNESGFVRQQRVGVCHGTPSTEDTDAFLDHVHASDTEPDAELVHDGPAPARELRERARRRGVRIRSFTEFQGLLDLRDYVTAQTERLRTDHRYRPDLYLPQRYREVERPGGEERDGLVDDMLRLLEADHGRFLLLLGDFGHGKTFALRELARRIPEEMPHLVPLFIELNTLDRAYSLEGLVAAHLANHGVDSVNLRAFRYMFQQGRIVLLFDGFDELANRVSYERATDRLQVLLDAVVDHAKVVVSSRNQHFKSQSQVLTALGERVGLLPQRRVLALQEFTPQQIRTYLANRYGDEQAADRRVRLLEGIPDLLALCRNPRLLSFVADLDHDRLRAVAGAGRALSAAGLYEEVLTSWLQFEERRGQGGVGAAPGMNLDQRWDAVTTLALRLWSSGRSTLSLDELTDVAGTLTGLADIRLSAREAAHAIGSGSLLVRSDEGLFQFIHSSIVEWLVAREAATRLVRGEYELLARRPLSQLTVEFLCDLADHRTCQEWAERVLDGPDEDGEGEGRRRGQADEVARANAVKVLARLRVPAHTDLRGAALAGEDLSHRDFSGVDLTRADLTDTQLVGANLSGAVLRDARLVGARLDDADLSGADLRGADLRRARLIRADLSGVRTAGSHWNRAALIDATIDDEALRRPELRTAALAPGMPVDAGFRPSAVGVPYGFGMQSVRLPEPVSYSTDGELLAVGSEDGGVLVCDAATGTALRTLQGHVGRVYAVKFRQDLLATGGADGTVRLWDAVSGACLHRLDIHPSGVWPVSLDPDGTLLATGDAEGTVTLWDVATGTRRHELLGHAAPVYTAVFSPDGRTLATGDAAAGVRLWDTRTGRLCAELPGHEGVCNRTQFSPDGSLLATGDRGGDQGGTVRVWDVASGRLRHTFTGHTGRVYTLDFHPSGTLLASGDTDGQVRLWDPVTGAPAGQPGRGSGAVYQVVFDSDGTLLAAGDSDGVVRLWRVQAGAAADGRGHPGDTPGWSVSPLRQQPADHRGSVWTCRFRPRGGIGGGDLGPLLVTAGNDGVVRLWDTASGQGRRILRGHGRRIGTLAFSADGSCLAASSNDGVVRLWEPATGRRLRELSGHSGRLVSAVFSPTGAGGALLGTSSNDGDVYLWNAATGEYQREIDAETDHVWAEAFSGDGELLATANDDDTVRLWYRSTGTHVTTLAQHRGRVRSIAFSADGTLLATGCDDRSVRLWDIQDSRLTAELDAHRDRVYAVAFGPGDSWLVSASWDGDALIWADGRPQHRLRGHSGRLWTAAVHPTRPLVATAGDDRIVRLWDPRDGQETGRLTGHTGRILSTAFSPDGSLLASGGEDGTVRLWTVPEQGEPSLQATLIGVPGGWAALSPSGGYKYEGDIAGEFWHAVGMCRFEPGELDGHLPGVRRLSLTAPLGGAAPEGS